MSFMIRLGVAALATACAIAIALLVALSEAKSADFDGDWLLEDLTCEEMVSGYHFQLEMLQQLITAWKQCHIYADSEAATKHELLHCALLKKQGQFVQGLANDIVAVHDIKCRPGV